MSAMAFAKNAFKTEKPHVRARPIHRLCFSDIPQSSITDWVDILTADALEDEAYDGIPELVDSINLQAAGPAEASRALRKKLKHGRPHQQYRALVILKALVENCGNKFQTTFADGQLTEALKHLANDSSADKKVKKKVLLVLASWKEQFKNDPSMSAVAGLYSQTKHERQERINQVDAVFGGGIPDVEALERESKRKAKLERERAKEMQRLEEAERRRSEKERKNRPKRLPFDFETEKPLVLGSIVDASQASSNLVNAITLVNPAKESLLTNERVQECLAKAKQVRKAVVRYIQLVENEELIGTLIEANDRIINALETYDKLSAQNPESEAEAANAVASPVATSHINTSETELNKLQVKQRAAIARAKQGSFRGKAPASDANLHPDLQDLSFGALGSSSQNLPAPLHPTSLSDDGDDVIEGNARGSLSDFSDYDSSDEETHNAAGSSKVHRDYVTVSDDDEPTARAGKGVKVGTPISEGALVDVEDPFADPFAG
ncbi:hypothetical protein GGX14DRAFT_589471 [Mycena pura]|uniref:VHS domain-containing protein n=1 Tax=Mycena pura TaxID=153505 RepID=A0AAD6US35_9AGAR|nr:hypothetical protein GGX14DRAFT_589471 [Mycena pura]